MLLIKQRAGVALSLLFALLLFFRPGAGRAATPGDVLPDYHNREVTALTEDAETVRLALGAAWDDAQACRAYSGYLRPWVTEDSKDAAEALLKRGATEYELVKCVDDGIESVRLARDSRDEPRLRDDIRFWRNELALAATNVLAYAHDAAALKTRLARQLQQAATGHAITAQRLAPLPWANPAREAWRQAGPAVGVRLPLDPDPDSQVTWWDNTLSVSPYYMASKLATAGDRYVAPEMPIGAWGYNCTAADKYDWKNFDDCVRALKARKQGVLLELPTLHATLDAKQLAALKQANLKTNWNMWDRYAPSLPDYLANDPAASLVARDDDGAMHAQGGVQLFDPQVAARYGAYLQAMAAQLKQAGLYDAIAAIHLERGDLPALALPENVDYSPLTCARWQAYLQQRYTSIAAFNQNAGTTYTAFTEVPLPTRALAPRAAQDWQAFSKLKNAHSERDWGGYLQKKYKDRDGIAAALGDSFANGYEWRLPFDYPPVIKIDYLRFRRTWVADYLAIKRKLAQAAFPDKLLIAQTWQFGDHYGVAGAGEEKWGGFYNEDLAQWTGVGADNADRPFMIRSAEPVGFGSRLSDSIESLYRDYLWIDFREPANLARYFYDWVAHGYIDEQFGWQSVTNHWLTNQLIYQIGPTVANTAPEPQRLGLLFPRATYDLYEGSIYDGYMGWDWLLNAAKLPYTRIDEQTIRDGGLEKLGLKVLILPEVKSMDKQVAAGIAQWVKAGGTLLTSTLPNTEDEYGRPVTDSPLLNVLGVQADGSVSEAIQDTPLTVTIPHGFYSGGWAEKTDRKPAFETLAVTTASVLSSYTGGKPAITANSYGKGRAVAMGYPFGAEAVQMERTSIGFGRTYVYYAREPQLVARTAWLRRFLVEQLGYQPDYGVDYAEVGRFSGREAIAPGFHTPKGLSQDANDSSYVRTFGDPRPDHQMTIAHEDPDMAIRFFPRQRDGVPTRYVGISTREVHYMAPRADVQMYLTPHTYHCRMNNPKIQAIWDVARNVPVGFARDAQGVSFNISLPSGHIMMLAVSETPTVQLFAPAPFPGRAPAAVLAQAKKLAGGARPPAVSVLTPTEIRPWFAHLAQPQPPASTGKAPSPKPSPTPPQKPVVFISYGQQANQPAAEKLAAFLRDKFSVDAQTVEQLTQQGKAAENSPVDYDKALIFIGDEWSNNDLAMHGAYWGTSYGPHMPFTTTYAWPGKGRAVISLSRRYALIDEKGKIVSYRFNDSIRLRPVEDKFSLVRRKLHIAANGDDAMMAVDAIIRLVGK